MRIFITGASGCIGHYITEILVKETKHELFLLVRNPSKLKVDYTIRPNIHILEADLRQIGQFKDLLKTIDIAILVATSWGGKEDSLTVNINQNLELVNSLDSQKCQQIIYFSTASILDRDNQLLPEAGTIGTDYIRTKYECYCQLQKLAIASRIKTIYPTLVFGGDGNKPYSHITAGLPELSKWMNWVKWFKADGSFHFIHAQDIAKVVKYLVENPQQPESKLVLGNEPTTVNQAIQEICDYLDKKIYVRIPLSMNLANFFIDKFNIQMAEWDRFCLDYRHFTYRKYFNPQSFGLTNYCSNIKDLLGKYL